MKVLMEQKFLLTHRNKSSRRCLSNQSDLGERLHYQSIGYNDTQKDDTHGRKHDTAIAH